MNIPGGIPFDLSKTKDQFDEHPECINGILTGLSNDEYKVIVLLVHVNPMYGQAGDSHEFFIEFSDIVKNIGKLTVYFHGDYHVYYERNGSNNNMDNYLRILLDGKSKAPPIRVEINVSKENPIKISQRNSELRVDCCSDGWPRNEEL